jgi:hypothetical protein
MGQGQSHRAQRCPGEVSSVRSDIPRSRFLDFQGDAPSSKMLKPRRSRPSIEGTLSADSTHGSDASANPVERPSVSANSQTPAEPAPWTSNAAESKPNHSGQEEGKAALGLGTRQSSTLQALGSRGSGSQHKEEGSFVPRESPLSSRGEAGKPEGRLAGWKEKLSRTHKNAGDAWGINGGEETRKVEEGEGAGRSFTGRMSNMLNAATHSLRPTSARKEPTRCGSRC